jgi:hypothetical protein
MTTADATKALQLSDWREKWRCNYSSDHFGLAIIAPKLLNLGNKHVTRRKEKGDKTSETRTDGEGKNTSTV